MVSLLALVVFSIFVYVNTLYYTLALLAIVLLLLYNLVALSMLHTLTMLMLLIVYVGAIIILIGYICAISPNLIISRSFLSSFPILFSFWFFTHMSLENGWVVAHSVSDPVSNYFYSSFGVLTFLLIIFMLFVTLLIVTSQYLAPKGPFRSISL